MPFINLIQEQRLNAAKQERRTRSLFYLFVATALGSAIGVGAMTMTLAGMKYEESQLEQRIAELQPMVGRIDENRGLIRQYQPRLKSLQDAQLVTQRWDRVLSHISHQTPQAAWLTGLRSAAAPEKPISIEFSGTAMAQEPVAEYILRMQNSEDLENVALDYTQEKLTRDLKTIEFRFKADIKGTAPVAAVQEDKS